MGVISGKDDNKGLVIIHADGTMTLCGVHIEGILFENVVFKHEGQGFPEWVTKMLEEQEANEDKGIGPGAMVN
jgi:hypothetical protein